MTRQGPRGMNANSSSTQNLYTLSMTCVQILHDTKFFPAGLAMRVKVRSLTTANSSVAKSLSIPSVVIRRAMKRTPIIPYC